MNKIKYILITLLIVVAGADTYAQRTRPPAFRDNRANTSKYSNRSTATKKLDEIRNNYISQRLNLTDDEADRFWPIYNQYQNELTEVLKARRANNTNNHGADQVDKDLYYEQKILSIRKHYRDEFLKIISPEKLSALYKSEREFKSELLKQWRERNIQPDDN